MSKKENSDRASDLDVEKTEHHAVFNDKVEAHRGGDEALRVLEHHAQEAPISPEEEKRLVRRIDYWMMPIMCITYGLQYIDKASLSIAAIFGIVQDLGLFRITGFRNGAPVIDTGRYSNVAMIFYVGYLVGAYPLAAIAQRLPAAKCCAIYVALWGLCSTLTPLCKDYKGMMVQRFFLGFLESGVSPAFLLMTGMWYRKEEVALRTAWWYSFTGFSVIVSIPISIGFLKIDSSLAPWQIIFYWWGAITIAWGLVVFLLLPDSPITAKFLNERERYVAIERLRANQAGLENKKFKGYQVLEALTDYKVWLLFAISFLLSAPNGAVSTFTPLVIKTFTASPFRTAVLTIPGGVTSFVSVVLSGYIASTWRGVRTYVLLFFCVPTLIGSSLLWKAGLSNRTAMLAGLYLQPTFSAAYVQVLAFAVSNVAGYTKKAVVSGLIFIAYCCGNIAGPLFFKAHEAPLYPSGFEATVTVTALGFGLAVVYRTILYFENKKRDNAGPPTGRDLAFDDVTDKENPRFRYSL